METVVACIDGSDCTASVCDHAAWAARRLGLPVRLVHALDRPPPPSGGMGGHLDLRDDDIPLQELALLDERADRIAEQKGRALLAAMARHLRAQGLGDVEERQPRGPLAGVLADMEPQARLLVLGRRHQGDPPARWHLDHHVERVIRAVERPVLVVGPDYAEPRRFAIAFDGSAAGRRVLEAIERGALLRGLACHLVMAAEDPAACRAPLESGRELLARAGFEVGTAALAGAPEAVLPAYLRRHAIDLLVIGAYGHNRIRQLVAGSTTTTLLRTSAVPVLVLR